MHLLEWITNHCSFVEITHILNRVLRLVAITIALRKIRRTARPECPSIETWNINWWTLTTTMLRLFCVKLVKMLILEYKRFQKLLPCWHRTRGIQQKFFFFTYFPKTRATAAICLQWRLSIATWMPDSAIILLNVICILYIYMSA